MGKADIVFTSLLVIFIMLVGTSLAIEYQIVDVEYKVYSCGGYRVSAMIVKPKVGEIRAITFLIPGFLETKTTFKSISIELAKMGVMSIALDLPGKGASNIPMHLDLYSNYNKTMNTALSQATEMYKVIIPKILEDFKVGKYAVLGIGFGASVSILLSSELNIFNATIAISPDVMNDFILSYINNKSPKNFLVILGSLEEGKFTKAVIMLRKAGVSDVKPNQVYGNFYLGTARMLGISELSTGFLQYFHGGTLSMVREWIQKSLNIKQPINFIHEDFRLYLLVLALFVSIAMLPFTPAVLSGRMGMFSGGKRWPTLDSYKRGLKLAIFWGVATLFYVPLVLPFILLFTKIIILPVFLAIIVSYDIVAIFLAMYLMIRSERVRMKKVFFDTLSELLSDTKNLKLGILVGVVELLLLLVALADVAIYPLDLIINFKLVLIAVLFFPLQLLMNLSYERFFRRYVQEAFGGVTLRAVVFTVGASFLARLLIMLFFALLMITFAPNLGFVLLIFILLTFVQMLIEGVAALTYVYTREITPAAIANSIWIFFVVALSPTLAAGTISIGAISL